MSRVRSNSEAYRRRKCFGHFRAPEEEHAHFTVSAFLELGCGSSRRNLAA